MSEKSKISTIDALEHISSISEEITPWAASKIISDAIREHTRAMIANDYYRRNASAIFLKGEDEIMANAIFYADKLIANLKHKPNNDEVPEPTT